jgi:PAS domain S-box-containing protein
MLDAIADYGIVRLNSSGAVTYWSAAAEALFGYSADEAVGQPSALLYTKEHRAAGLPEKELGEAADAGRCEFVGWRANKGGDVFAARGVITAIREDDGSVAGFATVVRDYAAEHRRMSNMFVSLLEAAPDAMLVVGADGRIVLANAQADRLFGYERTELVGKNAGIVIPRNLQAEYAEGHANFMADPMSAVGYPTELVVSHRDGTEIPVEVSVSPLEIEGKPHISVSLRDIAERKQFEQRLRRQHEEIMELSTPVIQVWDKVLTLPVIGTLDSMRAARLTEGLLARISETQSEVVIIDISGVPTIDTLVAQHLLRTVQAAALMGTVSIMSGVRPETAQAMVHLGIDVGKLLSRGTLQDALQLALQLLSERAEATRGASQLLGQPAAL